MADSLSVIIFLGGMSVCVLFLDSKWSGVWLLSVRGVIGQVVHYVTRIIKVIALS